MEATQLKEAPAHGAPVTELPTPPKKGGARRPFLILTVVAVVVVGAVVGHGILTAGEEDTDNAQVEADVIPLSSRVSGVIKHVAVQDDQPVKKGDVLFELDDADYAARVRQTEADLANAKAMADAADAQVHIAEASARGGFSQARAAVSTSSVGVGSAEAQIASAKAALLRAQTDLKQKELDLHRSQELRAANAIPQQKLDNDQLSFDAANIALEQAQANLKAAEENKTQAVSRVEEARGHLDQAAPINQAIAAARAAADAAHARVDSMTAVAELAKLQLGYTRVLAPSDGFVSKVGAREGQLIQPGQAIAELVPSTTYVVANFKETQIDGMKAGDRAVVEIDAFPGKSFEGTVVSLSGGTGARFSLLPPDNASGNFVKVVQRVPVRIAWAHAPDVPMRAGLSAEVTVHIGH